MPKNAEGSSGTDATEESDARDAAGTETLAASLARELTGRLIELLGDEGIIPNSKLLTLKADILEVNNSSTVYSHHHHEPQPQISTNELHLWRRQAQAIGRSPSHLQSIDRLLQLVQNNQHQVLDVSKRTYQVRLQDNEEFNEQAFVLFGRQQQLPLAVPKTYIKQYLSSQKLNSWWLYLKNHLQTIKTRLQDISQKIAARLYQLLK